MYTTGSLGFMLQGVSQQPQRVQPEGHVIEQINMQSDPNTGLSSRPGSELELITTTPFANAKHNTVVLNNKPYRVSTVDGDVALIDYEGVVYTIADPNNYKGYFGSDMAYYAKGDFIYCVNRNTVVEEAASSEAFIQNWAHAFALGGEFSRTYIVRVHYSDGGQPAGWYTTPDADATGAAAAVQPSNIIEQLRISLQGAVGWKAGSSVVRVANQLYISDNQNRIVNLTVEDGAGNTILRGGKGRVTTFADVPKYASHRSVLRVTGERGTLSDDTWLVFVSDISTVVGGGLGTSGVWQETVAPTDAINLNRATMPHALQITGTTAAVVRPEWEGRRVGNSEINPAPSFVGNTIRDIAGFQGRVVVISGPNAVMSRTDNNLDFFRRTATTVLATDPVDISTTGEDDSVMEWIIPYDNNLIIAARDGQFFISGTTSVTASNAAMPRSSNFEMSLLARPVVAGQTVMLPYKARAFSGVNEMLPTEEGTANTLESINSTTRKYIAGDITGMAASANANTLILQTDANAEFMYVYNFLWENNTKVQSAWHTWKMPDNIEHMYIRDSTVFVWTVSGDVTNLISLKLDRPIDPEIGLHITGDYQAAVDTTVEVRLPRNDYKFIGLVDGSVYSAGRTISPLSVTVDAGDFVYTLPTGIPPSVIAAVPVSIELRPNRAIAFDWRGEKKFNDTLILQKYQIDYETTGSIEAWMESVHFDPVMIANSTVIPAGDDPTDSFQTAVRTGTLEVPWGEDASLAQLVVKTETLQPTTIIEIRWAGQLYRGRL